MSAPAPSPFHMIFSPTYTENEIGNEYRSSDGYGSSKEAEEADDDHLYSDLDEPNEGKDNSRRRERSSDRDGCHLHYSDDNIEHTSRSLSTSHDDLQIALSKVAELEEEIKKLNNEKECYAKEKSVLEKNFSSLLMTARANLERKDRQLKELQKEFDNVVFRRGKANSKISQETIERLAEEKARVKIEAAMKSLPKETKNGDTIHLKDRTNCQVAMGNVTISFVTDHFDFASSRKRTGTESRTEVPRDEELPKPRRASSGTDKQFTNVQPSTSKICGEVKPRKPSHHTASTLSKTSASTRYSKEHTFPTTSRDEATLMPEKRVNLKSPYKTRPSSSRLPSSPRKRAREDSGGSKPDRKRKMTVKDYNNRRKDNETSQSKSNKVHSGEKFSTNERISPVAYTPQDPEENGVTDLPSPNMPSAGLPMPTSELEISPPAENPERTQTPLSDVLVKLDDSRKADSRASVSISCAVTTSSENSDSFASLVAAAAAALTKLPPAPDPERVVPERSAESLEKKSVNSLENELEEGELLDAEDVQSEQQTNCEETRDNHLCRNPPLESEKNRPSRTETGHRGRSNRRECSPRRRDQSFSHRTNDQRRSGHSSSRSSYSNSQHEGRSRKDESLHDGNRRATKLSSAPALNRSKGSPVRDSSVKRSSELERSIDPLDLQRILGKSKKP